MTKNDHHAVSVFPDEIDSRAFMSDTDLAHLDLLQQYQDLIRRGKYTEASRLLQNSGSFYYGAALFNNLEVRLYRLGQAIISKPEKEILGYYRAKTPASPKPGMYWIA